MQFTTLLARIRPGRQFPATSERASFDSDKYIALKRLAVRATTPDFLPTWKTKRMRDGRAGFRVRRRAAILAAGGVCPQSFQ